MENGKKEIQSARTSGKPYTASNWSSTAAWGLPYHCKYRKKIILKKEVYINSIIVTVEKNWLNKIQYIFIWLCVYKWVILIITLSIIISIFSDGFLTHLKSNLLFWMHLYNIIKNEIKIKWNEIKKSYLEIKVERMKVHVCNYVGIKN